MNFSGCHPFTVFVYFLTVTAADILVKNPIFLGISFFLGFIFRFVRKRSHKMLGEFFLYVLMTGIITLIVPLFSHNGATPLFFINSNAVTKEAFFCGLFTGIKLSAIFCWLSCAADVMTSDMIVYLISGISYRFAAFMSRALRFVPRAHRQFRSIYASQRSICPKRSLKLRFRMFFRSGLSLVTWIIESSADMSDSMYARGYGISKRRTSVTVYRLRYTDRNVLGVLLLTLLLTAGWRVLSSGEMLIYPETVFPDLSFGLLLMYIVWTILMLIPYLTEICEEYRWKLLRSRI